MGFEATDNRSFPTRPGGPTRGFANWLKTGVLLAAMTALILVVAGSIGGTTGLILGGAFALISNFVAYWWSDKIALKVHRAQEVTREQAPWFYDIVERLTRKAGLPMPRLYMIPSAAPNAFATGRNPEHAAVAVTAGIVRLLDKRELEGVIAHELAHVRNRDTLIATVAAAIAGAIAGIAGMMRWAMLFGGFGGRSSDDDRSGGLIGMLALIILAPVAATVLQLAISRSREYGADAYGGELCDDPGSLADALSKLESGNRAMPNDAHPQTASLFIVNPLSGKAMMSLFSTHPPTEERVRRLREMARSFA